MHALAKLQGVLCNPACRLSALTRIQGASTVSGLVKLWQYSCMLTTCNAAACDLVSGNCGNGPSVVVLPEAIMLRHVNTPKDVADVLAWQCQVDVPEALLRATEVGRGTGTWLLSTQLRQSFASDCTSAVGVAAVRLPVNVQLMAQT